MHSCGPRPRRSPGGPGGGELLRAAVAAAHSDPRTVDGPATGGHPRRFRWICRSRRIHEAHVGRGRPANEAQSRAALISQGEHMSIARTKVRLDFSSDEFLADPWPIYKQLRTSSPVHWSESFKAFLVTRFEDVVTMLADRRVVSGFPMRSSRRLFGPTLLDADGPSHRELRKIFMPLFAGASVKRLRTEILIP